MVKKIEITILHQEEAAVSLRWKCGIAFTVTLLWIGFIMFRSAKPASESNQESLYILELLRRLFPGMTHHFARKLAHFSEYFILGGLLFGLWRLLGKGNVLLPLTLAAGVACVDELLIQSHTPGRSGEAVDILLDYLGAAAAVGLFLLLRRRKERRSRERCGTKS